MAVIIGMWWSLQVCGGYIGILQLCRYVAVILGNCTSRLRAAKNLNKIRKKKIGKNVTFEYGRIL